MGAEIGGGRSEFHTSDNATKKRILRDAFRRGDVRGNSGGLHRYDDCAFH